MRVALKSRPRPREADPRSPGRRSQPAPGDEAAPAVPAPPRLPGRRNPAWIALGVLALCLGALLSYAIYSSIATDSTVVAMSRTVYRGQVIGRADLTTVVVQGSSVPQAVPARDLSGLVGRRAGFDLVSGSVVLTSATTETVIPAAGRAVVGLRLADGRSPAVLLTPSSPVRLVGLPPAAADSSSNDELVGKTFLARVVDQTPGADGTSTLLNVDVAADQAPTVALLAAQDRLAVVRDAER